MLDEKDLNQIKSLLEQTIDQRIGESENRMMAFFENAIDPKFNLLADGQKNLLETLTPVSRVEQLEDEVAFLKSAFRMLAESVNDLKKAQ